MKNLKMMSILLGGLLALGSLTACGGGDDDDTPEPTPTPPTPAEKVLTSVKTDYTATVSQQLHLDEECQHSPARQGRTKYPTHSEGCSGRG